MYRKYLLWYLECTQCSINDAVMPAPDKKAEKVAPFQRQEKVLWGVRSRNASRQDTQKWASQAYDICKWAA